MTAKSDAERARAYRDRKRGRATSLAPCGTRAAAARHRRGGEPLDERCKQAERDYQNQRNQAKATRSPRVPNGQSAPIR